MSEEFESNEGQEPIERVEDSREMGELSQMTDNPGAHLEATRETEQAEAVEIVFTETVEAEAIVRQDLVPNAAEDSGEAETLPLPTPGPKGEAEAGGRTSEVETLSPDQPVQQEADTPVVETGSEAPESKMAQPEANAVESLQDRPLEEVNEGAGEVAVMYDGEVFEIIDQERMLKLQLSMDKKDQAEKTFSTVISAFTSAQRDIVSNLK